MVFDGCAFGWAREAEAATSVATAVPETRAINVAATPLRPTYRVIPPAATVLQISSASYPLYGTHMLFSVEIRVL
jgi:hypothetical protein